MESALVPYSLLFYRDELCVCVCFFFFLIFYLTLNNGQYVVRLSDNDEEF